MMPPRLSTVAIAGALLLCVDLVLGVRSYSRCDVLWRPNKSAGRVTITSEFGKLVFELEDRRPTALIKPGWVYLDSPLPRLWPRRSDIAGFTLYRANIRHYLRLPPTRARGIGMPHWFVAVVCATPGIAWITRRRRQFLLDRRVRRGLCTACRYNLTGNQSGVCPECGIGALPART